MPLAIITSAPSDRPHYLNELLEVLALPNGMRGQFTYRKKWLSHGAWSVLALNQPCTGIIFYGEPTAARTRAYPLRIIRNIHIVKPILPDPSENSLLRIGFDVSSLYPWQGDGLGNVEYWSARLGNELRSIQANAPVVSTTLALPEYDSYVFAPNGYFVQSVDDTINADVQQLDHDAVERRWLTLTELLQRTKLSQHFLIHVPGVGERTNGPLLKPSVQPFNGYSFETAGSYQLRVLSWLPKEVRKTRHLRVKSDTNAITLSYPRQVISGQHRDEVVVVQVHRIQDRIVGALTLDLTSDDEGEELDANTRAARISFAVTCEHRGRRFSVYLAGIALGLLLANLSPELLAAWGMERSSPTTRPSAAAYTIAWIVKWIGLFMAAGCAYAGFRKVPG